MQHLILPSPPVLIAIGSYARAHGRHSCLAMAHGIPGMPESCLVDSGMRSTPGETAESQLPAATTLPQAKEPNGA